MRALLVAIYVLAGLASKAQDTVFKSDGKQIAAKVIEVSKSEIRYKLENDTTGPVYVLPKSEVYMVEYASGRKDVFAAENNEKSEVEKNSMRKEMTDLEILYRNRKGGGIAATIIGSLGLAATTIAMADGLIRLSNGSEGDVKKKFQLQSIASGAFLLISAVVLGSGVDNLVKASVIKTRIDKGEVSLSPVLIQGMSYNGSSIRNEQAMGVGVTVKF